MVPAELCVRVLAHNAAKHRLLFLRDLTLCAMEAGELRHAPGCPKRVRECANHSGEACTTSMRAPARVTLDRETLVMHANSSPRAWPGFLLLKKATIGSFNLCSVTAATPSRRGGAW